MQNPRKVPDDALRAAREQLIRRGLLNGTQLTEIVSPDIEHSWRRSIGVEASAGPEAFLFVNDFDPDGILIRAAKSVMDHWLESLNGMGISLFLSDQSGQIIARRLGDRTHGNRFDEAYAAEGFSFSERSVGTNGLGTPIEGRQAVLSAEPSISTRRWHPCRVQGPRFCTRSPAGCSDRFPSPATPLWTTRSCWPWPAKPAARSNADCSISAARRDSPWGCRNCV